jgi:hypothetical protein
VIYATLRGAALVGPTELGGTAVAVLDERDDAPSRVVDIDELVAAQ